MLWSENLKPGVAGWRLKPARRGSVRLGGAKAEARGRLPPSYTET